MGLVDINENPSRRLVGRAVLEGLRAALMDATTIMSGFHLSLVSYFSPQQKNVLVPHPPLSRCGLEVRRVFERR